MTKQTTPHTQTQQNVTPEQTDFELDQDAMESATGANAEGYSNMEGAETGTNRTPRKIDTRSEQHNTENAPVAHEGDLSTRTPKRRVQRITSHSAEEESAR